MIIYNKDKAGEPAIAAFILSANKAGNGAEVFDKAGGRLAFRLSSTEIINSLSIVGKGKGAVFSLTTGQAGSVIAISDTAGNIVEAFEVD